MFSGSPINDNLSLADELLVFRLIYFHHDFSYLLLLSFDIALTLGQLEIRILNIFFSLLDSNFLFLLHEFGFNLQGLVFEFPALDLVFESYILVQLL